MIWLGVVAVILAAAAHWVNPAVRAIGTLNPAGTVIRPAALGVNLLHSAGLLVVALMMLGGCVAAGRGIAGWLGGRRMPGGFALAAGALAASLAVMGLGLAGLLQRGPLGMVAAAGVAAAILGRIPGRAVRAWRAAPPGSLRPGWLLLPAVPSLLAAPLLPVTNVDMLEYHAGVPALWLLNHRIHAEPGHWLMMMPLGMERLLVLPAAFGFGGAMAWFHLGLVASAGASLASALARCGVAGAAWAGWAVVGWEAALHLGVEGHPDTGLVLASALLCRALVSGSGRELGVAGALAAATKYQGLVLLAGFMAAGIPWWRASGRAIRWIGWVVAVAVTASLPWLLRNAWLSGDPVFPFASGVFPVLGWTDWNSSVLWGSMRNASIEIDWVFPTEAVARFAAAFWTAAGSGWFPAHTALVYLLVPVVLFRFPGPVRRMAIAGLVFALVWLVPIPKFGRYLVPGLVPAIAAWWVCVSRLPGAAASAAAAGMILVQSLSLAASWSGEGVSPVRLLAGGATREAAARASMGIWLDVTRWINDRPGSGRTLVIGHGYGLGLVQPWRAANEVGPPAWLSAAGWQADPARLRIGLRQAGIGRVLYNPVRAFHRSGYWSGYGYRDDWILAWVDLWRRYAVLERAPAEADWTGAWFVWSLARTPRTSVPPPWVPGVEWLLLNEHDLASGRFDPARLARQRRLLPDVAASRYQAGIAVARTSRAAALRDVGAAVSTGVGLPGAWRVYAELLAGSGRPAEAAAALRQALAIEPGHRGAREELARLTAMGGTTR